MFEHCGRRTDDGRRIHWYSISSPCEPNGSGELKMDREEKFAFKTKEESEKIFHSLRYANYAEVLKAIANNSSFDMN